MEDGKRLIFLFYRFWHKVASARLYVHSAAIDFYLQPVKGAVGFDAIEGKLEHVDYFRSIDQVLESGFEVITPVKKNAACPIRKLTQRLFAQLH